MRIYTVTLSFSAPQLGVNLPVASTAGKISSRVACLIGGSEYASQAFYDWMGTPNSLNYLTLLGVFPDPPAPGVNVVGGTFAITSGSSVVTVVGAAFGFVPSLVVATVLKPAGGANLFPIIRTLTITADGFIADISAPAPTAGYVLAYAGVQ